VSIPPAQDRSDLPEPSDPILAQPAAEPEPVAPPEPAAPTPRGPSQRPGAWLGEWFTRRRAIAAAERVTAEHRASIETILALSDQRGEAAETLWTSGHLVEALRLAVDAFRALDELSVPESVQERVARARAAAAAEIPPLDPAMGAVHTERYEAIQVARRAWVRVERARIATTGALRWQRARRIVGLLLALAALGVLVWLAVRSPPRVDVSASGQFPGAQYAPGNAFDDDEATEWVLPDGEAGWVEARLSPPRDIGKVRILNGRNGRFGDRAIQDYEVTLYRGTEAVAQHEGSFERIDASPEWTDVPIGGRGITRIRVEALSHHQRGTALAEVAWDE